MQNEPIEIDDDLLGEVMGGRQTIPGWVTAEIYNVGDQFEGTSAEASFALREGAILLATA